MLKNGKLRLVLVACREHCILVIILCLAFIVRWHGIYFDYPGVNFVSDEVHNISFILKVIESKSLDVPVLIYPALLSFLYLPAVILKIGFTALKEGLLNVDALKDYFIVEGMGRLYIIGRWYSVFFGTATVFLIYRAYGLIFRNRVSALAASSAWAFSLVPVYLSHWGKVHSALIFFVVLSFYFALKFEKTKSLSPFYFSVVAAAAAFSVHYAGIMAGIFPALALVTNRRILNNGSALVATATYGVIAAFFYLVNFRGITEMVKSVWAGYYGVNEYVSLYAVGAAERFYYVFRDAFRLEPVWILLFGLIFAFNFVSFFKDRLRRYLLAGLGANYLLMVSFITAPGVSRHLATFLALTIPFAAGFVAEWLLSKNVMAKIALMVVAGLIVPSALVSLKWLSLLDSHTRLEAKAWLLNNIKKEEIVYSFDNYLDVPLSYEAARWQQQANGVYDSAKINYIVKNEDRFRYRGINLFYDLYEERYEYLGGVGTGYVVLHYWRADEKQRLITALTRYHDISLLKSFYPTADFNKAAAGIHDYINNPTDWKTVFLLEKGGPFVEIYKVGKKI